MNISDLDAGALIEFWRAAQRAVSQGPDQLHRYDLRLAEEEIVMRLGQRDRYKHQLGSLLGPVVTADGAPASADQVGDVAVAMRAIAEEVVDVALGRLQGVCEIWDRTMARNIAESRRR